MLGDDACTGAAVAATVASISRATTWTLVDELPLRFDVHHPQGMARVDSTWWISTVDTQSRRGLVMAADSHGNLVEQVPVGDSFRYHPGGMDFDGSAFWIACAEYRPGGKLMRVTVAVGRRGELGPRLRSTFCPRRSAR